jgi:hypothetical protein
MLLRPAAPRPPAEPWPSSDRIPYVAQVDRPKLRLPGGKKLAVWGDPQRRGMAHRKRHAAHGAVAADGTALLPDVPNWSWHEYGMRAGFWRQFKALTDRKFKVTLAINGNVCDAYPRVASACARGRLRIHGPWFSAGPDAQAPEPGRRHQARGRGDRKFTGKPPRSWESPGLTETEETLTCCASTASSTSRTG